MKSKGEGEEMIVGKNMDTRSTGLFCRTESQKIARESARVFRGAALIEKAAELGLPVSDRAIVRDFYPSS